MSVKDTFLAKVESMGTCDFTVADTSERNTMTSSSCLFFTQTQCEMKVTSCHCRRISSRSLDRVHPTTLKQWCLALINNSFKQLLTWYAIMLTVPVSQVFLMLCSFTTVHSSLVKLVLVLLTSTQYLLILYLSLFTDWETRYLLNLVTWLKRYVTASLRSECCIEALKNRTEGWKSSSLVVRYFIFLYFKVHF